MSKANKSYTDEFKQEAINLALSSPSITGVAKSLGIPEETLHTWVNRAKLIENASGKTNITPAKNKIALNKVLDENKELRKKVARLEQEKEILKKAATYFAKEL
ncbi:MAG: transposase [bacterium]|nr:transposase [bacterium]